MAQAEDMAAISFGWLATEFVRQPESWPVFLAWTGRVGSVPLIAKTPDEVAPLADNLLKRMMGAG